MPTEMAQFVRQHRLDLGGREAREQRVEQHDPLGRAEPGEIRVAVIRALRSVHHEQTARAETAAREKRIDASGQRRIAERGEAVEQRRDDRRVSEKQQEIERDPRAPDIQPPLRAHCRHEPKHEDDQGYPERCSDCALSREVGQKQSQRLPVEAEPRLDDERAP